MGMEHESARLLKEILEEVKLLRLDLMAAMLPVKVQPKPSKYEYTIEPFAGKKK